MKITEVQPVKLVATRVSLTGDRSTFTLDTTGARAPIVLAGPAIGSITRNGIPQKSIGLTAEAWKVLSAAGVGKTVTVLLQPSGRKASGTTARAAFPEPVAKAPRKARAPKGEPASE